MDLSKYVTRDELDGRLEPLGEIRTMLRDSISDLRNGQIALSQQLTAAEEGIKDRQNITNGRVLQAEKDIQDIKRNGCHQYATHLDTLGALSSVGVSPAGDNSARALITRKQVAVAGGIGLGGLGLGVLLPHLGELLDWLLHTFGIAKP